MWCPQLHKLCFWCIPNKDYGIKNTLFDTRIVCAEGCEFVIGSFWACACKLSWTLLFARLGSAERKEERKGKEGEFRNWTYYTMAFADSNTVVSMQWFQCSVRSGIIGIYEYSFTNNELEISLVVVVVNLFHEGSTWQYEQLRTQWPSKHSKYLH